MTTSNRSSVGIAVCGIGNIGVEHLENLRSLRGCKVVGIFDIDRQRSATISERFHVRQYGSYNELLADETSQAVILATPASLRRDGLQAAIAAGKHVFIEKPIADTLEDAEAIVAMTKGCKSVIQVGFCERFNAQYLEAHNAVSQLGRIRAVQTSRLSPIALGNVKWGLGVLDTAVHNFDLILWLTGDRPLGVSCYGVRVYPEIEIPTSVTTIVRFESGMIATDTMSWAKVDAHPMKICSRSRMSLQGERGIFEVDLNTRPCSLLTNESYDLPDTVLLGGPNYFGCLKLQLDAFLRAIETNGPSPVSVQDGLRAERVAIAAWESLREGREVLISEQSWNY